MTRNQTGRGRTPQQRKRDAQARRAAEASDAEPDADAVTASDGSNSAPPVTASAAVGGAPRRRRGRLTDEQIMALASTQWSVRGRLTLALIIGILVLPLGTLQYLFSHGGVVNVTGHGDLHYSYAYFLVFQLYPTIPPIPLLLTTFLGMPLARALAREQRNLRFMETLGFAAVVFLALTLVWANLPKSAASYTDLKVVAAGGLANVIGLVAGAYLYGPISYYLSPARRMRTR